ncbi:uncharacterized protein LOC111299926 isoform X1 [Durio zibethinus]|uniref:Uncharacterized protein LOC111299926 isoform X1 n=1 Tax=Durio zibethinus TaxID=66656 RepID=A0A6P5ZFT6_DURZI|nr:uncharacterized protein LOC111299926 isoform X1 [Durio zibethinus]
MRREEKRKRFHEALLKTLYPPSSPPESEEEEEKKPVITSERAVSLGLENPDDFEEAKSSSSTSNEEDDGSQAETQKLSRAQRKRLRKKKLKEDAFRRGKIIGPLLPLSEDGGVGLLQTEPQGVRENAADKQVDSSDKPDDDLLNALTLGVCSGDQQGGCSSSKKAKQRRIAKRLAREGLKSTETENSDQDKERQVL